LTIGTPGSPIGSAYDPRRLESLHGIIRQKDMQSQAAESLIKELRKQNEHLNSAAFQKHGLRTVDELLARANETEKENTDLRQEIITLKRIQAKQARALCDMTNTNDYPTKLRFLTDELRHYKNKVEDLKTELLNQQRLCHDYQVKFITIQKDYRRIKNKISNRQFTESMAISEQAELTNDGDISEEPKDELRKNAGSPTLMNNDYRLGTEQQSNLS
jgi:uncharacterized coiled-coil DUF342 family protein